MAEVQIVRIERRDLHQPSYIGNRQPLVLEQDQIVATEVLKRPVDVHRSQAGRIREVVLGQREIAASIAGQADGLQPKVKLHQQVGDALVGGALADVERPLALDCDLDQRLPP